MPNLFTALKFLHVLSAIVAVGTNATYGVWLARARRSPAQLPFALKTVKLLDDRLANPAYALLLVTGLAMVFAAPFEITTPWILTSLILYAGLFIIGVAGYTPALREQIRLAEAEGPQGHAYQAVARRGTILGLVLGLTAIVIVYLMVTKPPLWG